MAKVIPTHKNGTRDNVSYYRPISKTIKESKANLYWIRTIQKYLNPDEVKNLITAV